MKIKLKWNRNKTNCFISLSTVSTRETEIKQFKLFQSCFNKTRHDVSLFYVSSSCFSQSASCNADISSAHRTAHCVTRQWLRPFCQKQCRFTHGHLQLKQKIIKQNCFSDRRLQQNKILFQFYFYFSFTSRRPWTFTSYKLRFFEWLTVDRGPVNYNSGYTAKLTCWLHIYNVNVKDISRTYWEAGFYNQNNCLCLRCICYMGPTIKF